MGKDKKMDEELKACPFCGTSYMARDGGSGLELDSIYTTLDVWFVSCGNCGCTLTGYETKKDAIKAWNIRSDHSADNLEKVGRNSDRP